MLLDSFFWGGWGVLDWGPWFYGAGSPDAPWGFWSYRDPESSFLETFRILSGHWGLWFYRVFGVTVNARFYREWECIWTEPLNYSFSLLKKGISKSKEDLTPGMTDFILWKTCSPMCCQKICFFSPTAQANGVLSPEKLRCELVQALGQVQRARSRSTGFRRRFRRRSGRLRCRASQVQQGSGECSGEGLRGFGAEPGQVRQGSFLHQKASRRLSCRFRRRWEAFVQSLVRFNRGPVLHQKASRNFLRKLLGNPVEFGLDLHQSLPNRVPEKVPRSGRLWCSQVRFNRVPEKVPALGFAARFRKICKNKTLRLLGIPLKLISLICTRGWSGSSSTSGACYAAFSEQETQAMIIESCATLLRYASHNRKVVKEAKSWP